MNEQIIKIKNIEELLLLLTNALNYEDRKLNDVVQKILELNNDLPFDGYSDSVHKTNYILKTKYFEFNIQNLDLPIDNKIIIPLLQKYVNLPHIFNSNISPLQEQYTFGKSTTENYKNEFYLSQNIKYYPNQQKEFFPIPESTQQQYNIQQNKKTLFINQLEEFSKYNIPIKKETYDAVIGFVKKPKPFGLRLFTEQSKEESTFDLMNIVFYQQHKLNHQSIQEHSQLIIFFELKVYQYMSDIKKRNRF